MCWYILRQHMEFLKYPVFSKVTGALTDISGWNRRYTFSGVTLRHYTGRVNGLKDIRSVRFILTGHSLKTQRSRLRMSRRKWPDSWFSFQAYPLPIHIQL